MKHDMILAGVGGQGVLSIASVIGVAAVEGGLHLKQAEVHGMSQRGGAVQSHLRIADRPIYSDLIPEGSADMILSLEPMETLRYVSYLSAEGVIVADRTPVLNIHDYPEMELILAQYKVYARSFLVDAEGIAKKLRAGRASNMVLLGAASHYLPIAPEELEAGIGAIFSRKGEKVVAANVEAFRQGRAAITPV